MYKKRKFEPYLCQGDIIKNFESDLLQKFKPEESYFGIFILSFTCDLKHKKLEFINYCPIFDLDHRVKEVLDEIESNEDILKQIRKRKDPIEYVESKIKNILSEICNYRKQNIYFLQADSIFNNQESYANLEQIYSIPFVFHEELIKYREASLKNPWVENLGFMLGYCFNRVAMEDVKKKERDRLYEKRWKITIDDFVKNILNGKAT